jgi:hypothetical protein
LIPNTNKPAPPLDYWPFETTNWLTHYSNAPISFTNLVNVPYLGDGNCLLLDSTNNAWLQYPTSQNGTNRFSTARGSVTLWIASSSWSSTNAGGTGPGTWGRLLEIGAYTTNASYGWESLFLDPSGTHVYFASQTNDGSGATYLSAPVSFMTNRWHMLALTYSETNCAFYFDGELLTNGPGLAYLPPPDVVSNGIFIGSDVTGTEQARAMFDDLATYDYVLDADAISTGFNGSWVQYYANPLNDANHITSAPSTPGPFTLDSFNAITGPGYLNPISTNSSGCFTNSQIWITNFSIVSYSGTGTNRHATVQFQIAGGQDNVLYDVFANSILSPGSSTNAWAWMGEGRHCVTYQMTNFPTTSAFVILGTPLDSDGDGLTDAYELLVSKTDPNASDSDGSGLADWWQIVNFGYTGVDPFGDADGDGWSNLDEYLNGTNPNSFNTPPAPTGLTAEYKNGIATVSWNPSPGPVTGYIIERDIPQLGTTNYYTNAVNSCTHVDNPFPVAETNLFLGVPSYRATAIYPGGLSLTAKVNLYNSYSSYLSYSSFSDDSYGLASFIRGPQGNVYLAWSGANTNVPFVKLERVGYPTGTHTDWILTTSSFTNGICPVTQDIVSSLPSASTWTLIITNANGLDETIGVSDPIVDNWGVAIDLPPIAFFDGRQQLKENLAFLFRAATEEGPFSFSWENTPNWLEAFTCATNYAYSGLYDLGANSPFYNPPVLSRELMPFRMNALYRNFVLGTNADVDGYGKPITGAYSDWPALSLDYPWLYDFVPSTNSVAIPSLLATNDSRWIFTRLNEASYGDYLGLDPSSGPGDTVVLSGTDPNFFGLTYKSVKMAWTNYSGGPATTAVVSATSPGPLDGWFAGYFYPEAVQPQLQTTNYYFTRVPVRFQQDLYYGGSADALTPVPGQPNFSPAVTTPLLIASVGDPEFRVVGYAKQTLVNGYSGIYGYLGQYFEKAYKMGTNGVATTNETGVLSPYGDFFPTEPGPAALVTMTNWGVNERGTGVVNVIKLQLDVNHDGTMDPSFGGPDNTSPDHPYVFWINNDYDEADSDLIHRGTYPPFTPDSSFDSIRNYRNLEDFARLWICGLPKLPASNGYSATLSLTASSGNPSINIYSQNDADGSPAYLSDTNAAAAQFTNYIVNGQVLFDYSHKVGTVSASQSYNLSFYDDGTPVNTHFLFEGVATGSFQLQLSVWQGTNLLGQTSTWLDLHNVKDLYERMIITNNTAFAVTNWNFGIARIEYPRLLPQNEDTNIIVHCHGADTTNSAWLIGADTLFKRFYWAGFHGRFASVHWPSTRLKVVTPTLDSNLAYWFNTSEFTCYKSAFSLTNYIGQLHNRLPGYRLNIFAHSLGPALATEALKLGALCDNYIMSQGAMPASAYDVSAPTAADQVAQEAGSPTPDLQPLGYRGIYTNLSVRIVSMFNTNDAILNKWRLNQLYHKPTTILRDGLRWFYDGTNCWQVTTGFLSPPPRLVNDYQETRALVARSRTWPIGELGPASGQQGVVQTSLDLHALFNIQDSNEEHYAAFYRPIQTIRPYFQQILIQIRPPQ